MAWYFLLYESISIESFVKYNNN